MIYRIAIVMLLCVSIASAAETSADGLPLPEPTMTFAPVENLPVIGEILGKPIRDIPWKVYSVEKGKARIEKLNVGSVDAEWYAPGMHGSKLVEIWVSDGLVYSATMRFDNADKAEKLWARLSGNDQPATNVSLTPYVSARLSTDYDRTRGEIRFEIDNIEWVIQKSQASEDVATAMRDRTLIEGMTRVQAEAVLGKPGDTSTDSSGNSASRWVFREQRGVPGIGQGYTWVLVREVTAQFDSNAILVSFQDRKLD